MSASIEMISAGAFTTVQDLGRTGYLDIGVPPSGALDPVALRLANRLVGNEQGAAALEVLFAGPEIAVHAESVRVALVGAGSGIEVLHPEPAQVPAGQSVTLSRGARFRVMPLRTAACACLAFSGSFDLEPCMGSLSTYTRGGFGGLEGRVLEAGDHIALKRPEAPDGAELRLAGTFGAAAHSPVPIRVVMGPHEDHFAGDVIEAFLTAEFTVSQSSDRMGARLDGTLVEPQEYINFISDGITAGAIQVPGSGQPIILLADHQTSGGYPRIATVISADLPLLGRQRPGSVLTFHKVDVADAEAARREHERNIALQMQRIGPVTAAPEVDLDSLYSGNLISGVIDGATDA